MAAVLPASVTSMNPPASSAPASRALAVDAATPASSSSNSLHATSTFDPTVAASRSHNSPPEIPASSSAAGSGSLPANRFHQTDHFDSHHLQRFQDAWPLPHYTAQVAVPRLHTSSSNVSTSTVLTTETTATSPISTDGAYAHQKQAQDFPRPQQRPHTPSMPNGVNSVSPRTSLSASTSPMSIDSPYLNKPAKRTASGTIKTASEGISVATLSGMQSMGAYHGSLGRKPGVAELSAQLKTRLSYAMLKVQHGWERQSIEQLEAITPDRSVPATPISPTHDGRRHRLGACSEPSDRYMPSSAMDAIPQNVPRLLQELSDAAHSSWTSPSVGHTRSTAGPSLAPAAPITSANRPHRRTLSSRAPPSIPTAPTTPARSGILRMPSQQAEKDAVDTLIFMSSPNNSSNMKYATSGSTAMSPLRSEFSAPQPKRVAFDSSGMR